MHIFHRWGKWVYSTPKPEYAQQKSIEVKERICEKCGLRERKAA